MVNELIFFSSLIILAISALASLAISPSALMALVALQVVLMNLFVTKQITLFGFNATSTDALGIGAVLGINLLREYCGPQQARMAIIISFLAVSFYTIVSIIQLAYVPSALDEQQLHLVALLQPMPRILIASLATYLLVQMLEYRLYGLLHERFSGHYFIIRNYAVVLLTQLLDTILFTFLGLYGIVDHVGEIIVVSYLIKAVTIVCMTPLMVLCKKVMHRAGYVTF